MPVYKEKSIFKANKNLLGVYLTSRTHVNILRGYWLQQVP